MKNKACKWLRRATGLIATFALLFSQAGFASARIIFQDDTLHFIPSDGIRIDSDGTGADLTTDGSGNLTIDSAGNAVSLGAADTFTVTAGTTLGDLTATGVVDFSGASRMALDQGTSNPGTCTEGDIFYNTADNTVYICSATDTWSNTGPQDLEDVYSYDADNTLTTSNGAFTVNTGTNDFIVTSNDWSVDAAGALTATSLTADQINLNASTITLSGLTGTNTLDITDNVADALSVTHGGSDFMVFDTTNSSESLTITPATTVTGAATFNGGISADGGVFTVADTSGNLHTSGTLDADGATTLDQVTINTADGAFAVSGANLVSIDSDSTSSLTGAGLTLGSDGAGNEVDITSAGTAASAINIDVSGTGGGIDVDTADGAVAITAAGAANGDITLTSGDDFAVSSTGLVDIDSVEALSINSSGGVINVGNDAVAQNINIGTGAAARTITIGNTTGATTLDLDSGTGGINAASSGDANFSLTDAAADSTFTITNPDATYEANLSVEGDATIGGVITAGSGSNQLTNAAGLIDGTKFQTETIPANALDSTNSVGAGVDNYVLSYDNGTGGFTWVDPGGLTAGDANTLDGLDSLQFLRSDTSDSFTSGTLTLDAGTTLDVNGSADFTGAEVLGASPLVLEGDTPDGFETTIAVTDPGADYTITVPAITGTLVTTGDTGSVSSTMITDGTIVNGDINASAAIDFSKLAALTSGNILVGNGSNVATSVGMSGDVAIDNTGATTIQADSVALATDTTGNYVATIADAGNGTITVANSGTENAGVTLDLTADGVDDTHIDWGTGANQVSGGDVPLADSNGYFTTDDVESALQELGGDLGTLEAIEQDNLYLTPEYTNYALSNTGNGMMEVLYNTTYDNYFKWTSQQATKQQKDIVVQVQLPEDFSSLTSIDVQYDTGTINDADNLIGITYYDGTADATHTTACELTAIVDQSPGSGSWNTHTMNNDSCTLTAGDILDIVISMEANSNSGAAALVGAIDITYANQ